jgi:alpha-glucosidase
MLAAPVITPADKTSGLATESVWLPAGKGPQDEWIEWPTGKHLAGGASYVRSFSIDQTPVYLRPGAIVPMQPPMRYTGEKPVDPLIVNVWPLAPGSTSTYSVYEDSGHSVDYQHGVYTRTSIRATQAGDTLKVEIGPVQGGFPGMLTARAYEIRLPADWPPASVTVNGVAIKRAPPAGPGLSQKTGWSFVGNTLTTVIPVASLSASTQVTVEVRRAPGLTARRAELNGFAGAMGRLRGTYDAMNRTQPVAEPPDVLVEAMQTGDRLSYHPETAPKELVQLRDLLPKAQAAIALIGQTFAAHQDAYDQSAKGRQWLPIPIDYDADDKARLDAMAKARILIDAAGK